MSGLELQYGYSASLANVLRMYCAYIVMDGWVDGSMVVNEVDAFIAKTMKRRIHENDLAGLENMIRRKTQSTQPDTQRTGRNTGRRTGRSTSRNTSRRPETNRSQATGRDTTEAQKLASTLDDWTLLDAFDALNISIVALGLAPKKI